MILHIPHSLTVIPDRYKTGWIGNPFEAIRVLTDHYTDELFDYPTAKRIVFPISRIVCDVERFETGEEMESRYGMGIVYERDHLQNPLRRLSPTLKEEILNTYYRTHHQALSDAVEGEITQLSTAMIVDCHSFNDEHLSHVENTQRPDFCIGADSYHTPPDLVARLVRFLQEQGYSVLVNEPFSGTIVPLKFYQTDIRVHSIMIEVNKRLYLTQEYEKNSNFRQIHSVLSKMLHFIDTWSGIK
jgi:N-formylglutamate amidohydrolase